MKWTQRVFKQKDFTYRFVEPEKNGDYWVTDGYYVHMAHYHKNASGDDWGIYQPDSSGVMRRCITVSDMNFFIVGWAEMAFPKIPKKYQELH